MKTKPTFIFWVTLFYLLLPAMPSWAFYNPSAGRWLNRDPVEEDGGINLHAFLANDPIDGFDKLGQTKSDPWPSDVPAGFKEVIEQIKQASGSRRDLTPKEIKALYQAEMEEKGSMREILKRGGNKRNSLSEHRRRSGGSGTRGFVSTKLAAAGAAV